MLDGPFNSPFIQQKGIHVLVMLEYNTRQKQNKTKPHPALIPHAVPYAGQTPASDLYLKGVPRWGEQCLVESFPTRVTPHLKCTCNGVHKHQSHFIPFMKHYMKCSVSCMRCNPSCSQPESQPTPPHLQFQSVETNHWYLTQ